MVQVTAESAGAPETCRAFVDSPMNYLDDAPEAGFVGRRFGSPGRGIALHGLLILAWLTSGCGPAAPPGPNLVLVTIDTLRADFLGVYGGPVATPAMGTVAEQGVVLMGMCTSTPSTGPAHASLLTGLYPWNHEVLANAVPFAAEKPPRLAEILRQEGFATGAFVSSYMLHSRWGFGRGFDDYHFDPNYWTQWSGKRMPFWSRGSDTVDAANQWIEEHRQDRFFLWLHLFEPHIPYFSPASFRPDASEPIDLDGKVVPPQLKSLDELEERIRGYRGEVAYTDELIGRLTATLEKAGVADRTALILTSDHGEGLGDHGLLGHGRNLFDEQIRVPLLIRAPGLKGGRRLEGPAQLEDLLPTILSLLDLPAAEGVDGLDLMPWIRGEREDSPRVSVLGQRAPFRDRPVLFFERRHPHKWIGELDGAGFRYQLEEDPREARGSPGTAAPGRLRRAGAGRIAGKLELHLDREAREALEALGYLEEVEAAAKGSAP